MIINLIGQEAHSDYLRSIAVHPTQPFLLTSSDDMLIKLWDWEDKWKLKQTFEGFFPIKYLGLNALDDD